MTVKVKVSVTQSDIDNGIRGDCWRCPVALAMWRATGCKWSVGEWSMWPVGAMKDGKVATPASVAGFIRKYDGAMKSRRGAVEPFEFEIGVPEQYVVAGLGTAAK